MNLSDRNLSNNSENKKENSPEKTSPLDACFSDEYRITYRETVRQLEELVATLDDPDRPLVPDGSGRSYSAKDILKEVKSQSEFGIKYVESMVRLKKDLDSLQ